MLRRVAGPLFKVDGVRARVALWAPEGETPVFKVWAGNTKVVLPLVGEDISLLRTHLEDMVSILNELEEEEKAFSG